MTARQVWLTWLVGLVVAVLGVIFTFLQWQYPKSSPSSTSTSAQLGLPPTVSKQTGASPTSASPTPTSRGSSKVPPATSSTDSANDSQATPESISLSQLEPVTGDVSTDPDSLLNKQYVDLVRQDVVKCNKNYADYSVPAGMKAFTAKAGLDDQYPDSRRWIFAVYTTSNGGMTNQAFKEPLKFGQHANISISLKGVLRLRIGVESVNEKWDTCAPYNGYNAVWANAVFSR